MIKNTAIKIIVFSLFIITFIGCKEKRIINFPKTDLTSENIIPKPLSIVSDSSGFALDKYTIIRTSEFQDFEQVGNFLSEKIKSETDLNIQVNTNKNTKFQTVILIKKKDKKNSDKPEAYQLKITQDSIILNSNTAEGAFRGIQTLRQIIPEAGNDTLTDNKIWIIPSGEIFDAPQFEYRGTMLDVSRHFFDVQDIKKYIDVLSYYKFNILHLHLSDDQGWRIEIKSWPKLTETGGSTEVGGKSGGFYTQKEYSEIVNYAASHYITIVPEIDMPGHSNAASVSYPVLNGNGKIPKLYEGTKVGFSTFDTRKDTVYKFIDDVIREIAALTPGPYIHIGGDESHVTKKNDYIYFINKVEKIIQKYGKHMIGWDEIANTDVDSSSIIQFWANKKNAQTAANKKMKIIMSPAAKAYLDMQYDSLSEYGLHWAGYIPVDTSYRWSPETYKNVPLNSIIGIEAPLWSETVSNMNELEYLAFPRIIGYAELGWSSPENRNWDNYKIRLANQSPYLNRMKIKYYPSPLIDWKKSTKKQSR